MRNRTGDLRIDRKGRERIFNGLGWSLTLKQIDSETQSKGGLKNKIIFSNWDAWVGDDAHMIRLKQLRQDYIDMIITEIERIIRMIDKKNHKVLDSIYKKVESLNDNLLKLEEEIRDRGL